MLLMGREPHFWWSSKALRRKFKQDSQVWTNNPILAIAPPIVSSYYCIELDEEKIQLRKNIYIFL